MNVSLLCNLPTRDGAKEAINILFTTLLDKAHLEHLTIEEMDAAFRINLNVSCLPGIERSDFEQALKIAVAEHTHLQLGPIENQMLISGLKLVKTSEHGDKYHVSPLLLEYLLGEKIELMPRRKTKLQDLLSDREIADILFMRKAEGLEVEIKSAEEKTPLSFAYRTMIEIAYRKRAKLVDFISPTSGDIVFNLPREGEPTLYYNSRRALLTSMEKNTASDMRRASAKDVGFFKRRERFHMSLAIAALDYLQELTGLPDKWTASRDGKQFFLKHTSEKLLQKIADALSEKEVCQAEVRISKGGDEATLTLVNVQHYKLASLTPEQFELGREIAAKNTAIHFD